MKWGCIMSCGKMNMTAMTFDSASVSSEITITRTVFVMNIFTALGTYVCSADELQSGSHYRGGL